MTRELSPASPSGSGNFCRPLFEFLRCASREYQARFLRVFRLTGIGDFDTFEKFAPKRRGRCVNAENRASAHQVRGQPKRKFGPRSKGYRSGGPPSRIFDKLVERASREMQSSLARSVSQGKVPSAVEAQGTAALTDLRRVGRHQVSNESLILAQNQRWRRA